MLLHSSSPTDPAWLSSVLPTTFVAKLVAWHRSCPPPSPLWQLFAALAASLRAHHLGLHEAPPRRVAKRRFRTAASWIVSLLKGTTIPLQHTIFTSPAAIDKEQLRIEFDASPWGGGFILREKGQVSEWGTTTWSDRPAGHLGVTPGLPKHQTFWELATFHR